MEILIVILLVMLTKKILDFIRYAANGDTNGALTQIAAWVVGIVVTYLAIWANWAGVAGDVWPRVLWGFYLGSAAAVIHDLFKAIAKSWTRAPLLPDGRPGSVTPVT